MQLRVFMVMISLLTGNILCYAQNKKYTDSLITVLEKNPQYPVKEKQALLEKIIFDLVEYDSLHAEQYLANWKKNYYPIDIPRKIFYHKNKGILYFNYYDFGKALKEISQGIELAKKGNAAISLADLYNNRANVYSDLENDQKALEDYDSAISIYRRKGLKADEALTLSNKANLYGAKGKFKEGIPFALESLKIREKLNDQRGMANTSFNLGIMFKNIGRYKEALEYLSFPEEYYRKEKNERSLATVQLIKGSVYRSKKMYSISKEYFQKALPVLESYQFKGGMINAYENLGTLAALDEKDENLALNYYLKAEKIANTLNNVQGWISTGINVAQSYLILKEFEKFNEKVNKIETLARKHQYSQELQEILKLKLNYSFEKSGELAGKDYLDEFEKIRDSVNHKDVQQQISNLKIKYETEKKEAQIQLLNSQNELQKEVLSKNHLELLNKALELDKQNLRIGNQELQISNQNLDIKNKEVAITNKNLQLKNQDQKIDLLGLGNKNKTLEIQKKNSQIMYGLGAFVFLLLLSILFYNRNKLRHRAKLQEAIIKEQDKSASAIISAEENERSRMSQSLHDGLGQLLSATKMNLQAALEHLPEHEKSSKIYSNALQLVDESITEMRSVSHQMVTNNVMRKGLANALKELIEKIESNKLRITLDTKGLLQEIKPEIQLVVYRILQESIQNVIKHADASQVDIILDAKQDLLHASISDNGKGFDSNTLKQHKGIGIDNIDTRVRFLKGTYKITSTPGNGTWIELDIPLNNNQS